MSLKTYISGFVFSSVLCSGAFILTLVNANPSQGTAVLGSFYISLFITLLATLTLIGYGIRRYLSHNELKYALIQTSFRQSFLLAIGVISLLLLQAVRLAAWWDILLIMVILLLTELYLRAYGGSRQVR